MNMLIKHAKMDPSASDHIELVIPKFLQQNLNCFNVRKENDVAHLYNITMKTPENAPLYISNEEDLRDALKQYCLYKHMCEKVNSEMEEMNLEFHLSDTSAKLENKASFKAPEVVSLVSNSMRIKSAPPCLPECGNRYAIEEVPRRIEQQPPPARKKCCCTIL